MLSLTSIELINVTGGTKLYIAPSFAHFTRIYNFTYNFIKSLIR